MLTYLNTRIKQLQDKELEAMANQDWELSTKVNFAVMELLDCKSEYLQQRADKNLEKLNGR